MQPKGLNILSVVVLFIGIFILGYSIYASDVQNRYDADAGVLDDEYTLGNEPSEFNPDNSRKFCEERGGVWEPIVWTDGTILGYKCSLPGGQIYRFKPSGEIWGGGLGN